MKICAKIYTARDEESNVGWVWVTGIGERTPVKIICRCTKRHIFCEARKIESNFEDQYYEPPRKGRIKLSLAPPSSEQARLYDVQEVGDDSLFGRSRRYRIAGEVLVISEWYRRVLHINDSKKFPRGPGHPPVPFIVKPLSLPLWRHLRIAAYHPDTMVRLAAQLGVIGAWLGVLGITDPILKVIDEHIRPATEGFIIVGIAFIAAAAGFAACWPPKKPE